jgi:CBS domain-containing protein
VLLREIMTATVITAAPQTPVRRVAELMRDRNVGSVVLTDDADRPVGIITDRDLAIGVLAGAGEPGDPAARCATAPVVTGEQDMELEEAAALMVGHRIRRLPVVETERLVGIVTLDDIAVRTGNLEVAQQMTADVARAAFPEFYFHQRGG